MRGCGVWRKRTRSRADRDDMRVLISRRHSGSDRADSASVASCVFKRRSRCVPNRAGLVHTEALAGEWSELNRAVRRLIVP
jgi:hypothetical protein